MLQRKICHLHQQLQSRLGSDQCHGIGNMHGLRHTGEYGVEL
jgi:hypothetical protein